MKQFRYSEDVAINSVFGGADDTYITQDTWPVFVEALNNGSLDFMINYLENDIEKDEYLPGNEYSESIGDAVDAVKSGVKAGVGAIKGAYHGAKEKRLLAELNAVRAKQGKKPLAELPESNDEDEGVTKTDQQQIQQPSTPEEAKANELNEIKREKFRTQAIAHMMKSGVADKTKRELAMKAINNLIEIAKSKKVGKEVFNKVSNLIRKEYDRKIQNKSKEQTI